MSYPRLSFGFSSILELNTQFIARYLIFALYVNSRWNGWFFGLFWSIEMKSRKLEGTSRCPNIAMSGQREEEVNK